MHTGNGNLQNHAVYTLLQFYFSFFLEIGNNTTASNRCRCYTTNTIQYTRLSL